MVICDTSMFAPDLPTLTTGLRGIVYGEIHVQGARSDLHSGDYGGAAPNAIEAAAQIIAKLKDRDGHILIPGALRSRGEARAGRSRGVEDAAVRSRGVSRKRNRLDGTGGRAGVSDLRTRVRARPTLEIHGIRGGFTAEGAKTVIPAKAVIKISLRLVPDQRPDEVIQQLESAIAAAAPRGVTATFKLLSAAPASVVDPDHPLIRKAADAMTKVFGHETVYVRCGGSIPIVGLFQRGARDSERAGGIRTAGRQHSRAERKDVDRELRARHRCDGRVFQACRGLIPLVLRPVDRLATKRKKGAKKGEKRGTDHSVHGRIGPREEEHTCGDRAVCPPFFAFFRPFFPLSCQPINRPEH